MRIPSKSLVLATFIISTLVVLSVQAATKYKGINSSPPKAGVKLLEDIFKRVHNEPQLAMSGNGNDLNAQAQQSPSALDLSLAVKPKESGRLSSSSAPELKLLPSQLALSGFRDKFGQNNTTNLNQIPIASTPKPSPIETWMGAAKQEGVSNESSSKPSGIWEKEQDSQLAYQSQDRVPARSPYISNYEERKKSKALPTQSVQSLATSANNLYQVAKKLDEMQNSPMPAPAPASGSPAKYLSKANTPPTREHLLARSPSGGGGSTAQSAFHEPTTRSDGRNIDAKKQREEMIALLPPNVVTGIPLISLGVSEAQASTSLSELGHMSHEKLNNWSIWSWQRDVRFPQTALQLYMKHGMLEAMRIFDSSLIAPNFGVNLGDDISKVKEKFGEPAFIIGEPESGSGQNYIYPISQIGFQLVRLGPNDTPKVISVLIFNVK